MLKKIRDNLIALISVLIAVSALLYSTWRLEVTENNRNVRIASFEALKSLTDLQLLIDYAYYDKDPDKGNPITGWSHVIYIKDLSGTISPEMVIESDNLFQSWQNNWEELQTDETAQEKLTKQIKQTRESALEAMKALE